MPDALENLTMKEFYLLLDGHYARKKEEDYKQAYFTYWMLAPNLGRESKITVDDIFNPLHQDMEKRNYYVHLIYKERRWNDGNNHSRFRG